MSNSNVMQPVRVTDIETLMAAIATFDARGRFEDCPLGSKVWSRLLIGHDVARAILLENVELEYKGFTIEFSLPDAHNTVRVAFTNPLKRS